MSFVLDALRKSEHERQRQLGPGIAELPAARPERRPPWALVAIVLLVVLNVAVLGILLLRNTPPAEPAGASATATPTPPATAPPVTPPLATPALTSSMEVRPLLAEPQPAAETVAPPPAPDPTLLPFGATAVPGLRPAATPEDTAGLPPISALPATATAGLPQLSMDLHVYTDDPARRAVFINGRRYQRGGVLTEGPTLREITREGAILDYRGQRFLLPRQ